MGLKFLVVGNEVFEGDDVAVQLIPILKKIFPGHEFVEFDPNEDIEDEEVFIIDVVKGVNTVTLLSEKDLGNLKEYKKVSVHDFDLAFQLRLLTNLGIVKKVNIIAIPFGARPEAVIADVCEMIRRISR